MGVFSGIEKAEVFGGGINIEAGVHLLEVVELTTHRSRKANGVVFFIAEFKVLESRGGRPVSAEPLEDGQRHALSVAHPIGESASWKVNMSKKSALGNVKGFAMALAPGATEGDITEAMLESLIASDQPARGIKIKCDARIGLTQTNPHDFTFITWTAYTPPA